MIPNMKGKNNRFTRYMICGIYIFLMTFECNLLGEKRERQRWQGEKGVVNEQGERCCLLSLEISSPDKFYYFIAWHLFCVSS